MMSMMDLNAEIERLEYTLAVTSIDMGRGLNPGGLDLAFMERALVLLRAYRDMHGKDSDLHAIMNRIPQTSFGNFPETDDKVRSIRAMLVDDGVTA
jgi:hypothetical protein